MRCPARHAHRNCIVNAVVKNKQIITARNERLGKARKRKTRKEILAAMDLQVHYLYKHPRLFVVDDCEQRGFRSLLDRAQGSSQMR